MSLRARIAALTAGAVAIAVLIVSIGAWVLVRRELRSQVDESLVERAVLVRRAPRVAPFEHPIPRPGLADVLGSLEESIVQVIDRSGAVAMPAHVMSEHGSQQVEIPVTDRDRSVASGSGSAYLRDARLPDRHLRVLTSPLRGGAMQLGRDLEEVDATLRGFAIVLFILAGLGIAGAAGAGLLVARRGIAPVKRLTDAAEHVAATRDLGARIDVEGYDELARLGRSFNEMLGALSQSREQQQRLVHDASHELRTPLTSLRTNVEVLLQQSNIRPRERQRILTDLNLELTELSALVGELVALATEQSAGDDEEATGVRLDEISEVAVERARRRTGRTIELHASPNEIVGRPLALERAIGNLVDNACKWGPPDEPIEVTVAEGRVEVRDRGPGIAPDDRPHVFDRFYRSTAARSMPGSGLGLAIVKQVAESHGGRVWAEDPSDGGPGAIVGFDVGSGDS